MPKVTSSYVCQQCGYRAPQYLGKCPQCDSWNSFVETLEKGTGDRLQGTVQKAEVVNLSNIEAVNYQRLDTKFTEFNRVLGGGVVLGSVVLVAGDPGIGKSTLLTQLALNVNTPVILNGAKHSEESLADASLKQVKRSFAGAQDDKRNVLYVAGEESAQQIKIRTERIKKGADLSIINTTDVDTVCEAIVTLKPALVIVDSIQTLETVDLQSVAGSVGQIRECSHRLQRVAKQSHIPIFLVGHITKEGNIAGPKTLEHLVDVVLSLEGEPNSLYRILRSTKNRFGPTDEVGIFEMEEGGMAEVVNPSKIFLDQKVNAPGSAVVVALTGLRPLLVEIQALVVKTSLPAPRRTGSGVDNYRLQLLVAVLQKRLGLPLYDQDIFVNVTGGLKISEPAVDLGICLAIVSSFKDKPIKDKTAFIGEVGLLGELRAVKELDKRVREAKKIGFTDIVSSQNVKSLAQAVKLTLN